MNLDARAIVSANDRSHRIASDFKSSGKRVVCSAADRVHSGQFWHAKSAVDRERIKWIC